jgi:nitrogen PTS system EIIA component
MTALSSMVTPERVVRLEGLDKERALSRLIDVLSAAPEVTDAAALREAIHERETVMSTGIGLGIAVPHAKIPSVTGLVLAIGVTRDGLNYGSIDDKPVHVVVMVAAAAGQQDAYLRTLARVVLVLKNPKVRQAMIDAPDSVGVHAVIRDY